MLLETQSKPQTVSPSLLTILVRGGMENQGQLETKSSKQVKQLYSNHKARKRSLRLQRKFKAIMSRPMKNKKTMLPSWNANMQSGTK